MYIFIYSLYILTESASPAGLAAVYNRLRSAEPISYGVQFFRSRGVFIRLSDQFLLENKVIQEGFIIGISERNIIHPIYDKNYQAVVIRLSDMMNIPIGAFDAMELPFYKNVHPSHQPHNHQPGEGSSRGNN